MRKLLLLSLIAITGISLADTTPNLVNEQGQLDHSSTYYHTESSEVYVIPQDADWRNPESIEWSVDVRSFDNAVGCYSNCVDDVAKIELEFYTETGDYLTKTGPGMITLDYDGGGWSGWVTYSGSYNDDQYLSQIDKVVFTVGGMDNGYWGGNYGPEFKNASMMFVYNPVEESLIIEVEQEMFKLIEDLEKGYIELDEFNYKLDDIKVDFEEDMKMDIEMDIMPDMELKEFTAEVFDEFKEDTKEVKTEIKQPTIKTTTPKQNVKQVVKPVEKVNPATQYNFVPVDTTTNKALEVLQLIEPTVVVNVINDIIDISSYTSVTYSDSIQLEDTEDWYQNAAFYETLANLPDSGILANYNNSLRDNEEWYGSNSKFY